MAAGDSQDWGIRFRLPLVTTELIKHQMTMSSAVLVTRRLEWAPRFV